MYDVVHPDLSVKDFLDTEFWVWESNVGQKLKVKDLWCLTPEKVGKDEDAAQPGPGDAPAGDQEQAPGLAGFGRDHVQGSVHLGRVDLPVLLCGTGQR
jgi:hypothetical protein